MSYIDRIKVGSTTHLIEPTLYAECTTAAATATKQTAAINNFNLVAGVQVAVKFTVTNTAAVSDLKLQIGTTTAKSIKYRGENLPSIGTLAANHIYNFVYDGTYWELVGDLDTNTQSAYGNITTAGKIGTTADLAVYTTTGGLVTAGTLKTDAPTASGTATAFITSVSQDSKGKISASKANLPTASTDTAGIIKIGTTANDAAAGNHNHDSAYVKKAGDLMTGKLWIASTSESLDTLTSTSTPRATGTLLEIRHATNSSSDIAWPVSIKNVNNENTNDEWSTGIKLALGGVTETGKWVGIRAVNVGAYANTTVMDFYANETRAMRMADTWLAPEVSESMTLGTSSRVWKSLYTKDAIISGSIYFGPITTGTSKAILVYNSTSSKYGIWYYNDTKDKLMISASGNADSLTAADFTIEQGGLLYNKGNIIPHTGNATGTVGSTKKPVYLDGGQIKEISYTIEKSVPSNAVFTDTNKYHKSGSWSGLTYTATAVNSADELKFTIPTGTSGTTVAVGNHNHDGVYAPAVTGGYLPLSGGTMTGDIKGNAAVALGTVANPFHNIVLGGTTNATMTAASTNPRITFQEGTGTQPVHLIYTDQDSYRSPAGLKVIGGSSATPAWFEVEGNVYAAAFKGNADTATALTSNAGDTEQPIYFSSGKPVATSYSLAASVGSGTKDFLSKYTDVHSIGSSTICNITNISYSTITPNYTSGGEQYYKAWLTYICNHYSTADIYIGLTNPNSKGPILGNIYDVTDRDSTTELPRYSTFLFHNLNGSLESFGTHNYNYYHRTYLTDNNYTSYAYALDGSNTGTKLQIKTNSAAYTNGIQFMYSTTKKGSIGADNTGTIGMYGTKIVLRPVLDASTKGVEVTTTAMYPTDSMTLGTTSNKWSTVYATTFNGNLTGNVTGNITGNVSGTANNVTGIVAVANGGTGETTKLAAGLIYSWTAVVKGQTWSRLCYIPYSTQTTGTSVIINVRATRGNVVYNYSLIIHSFHGNPQSYINVLQGHNYSPIKVRSVVNTHGNMYIELYDDANSIAATDTQNVSCNMLILTKGSTEPTLYTTFTNGTTVPSDYTAKELALVAKGGFQTNGNMYATEFIPTGSTTSLKDNNLTFAQGGGWYMSDATWIRTVGSKSVYMNAGTFRNDGTTQLRNLQHINANAIADGSWTTEATGTAGDGTNAGTLGTSILTIGNSIAQSTASGSGKDNSQGYLRLYNSASGYSELTSYGTWVYPTTGLAIPIDKIGIMFRPSSSSYYTHISYQTGNNEALVAATQNAVTSFIFINGESYANVSSTRWRSLTPALQIKNNSVIIGKLIDTGITPSYKFEVNGTSYFSKGILGTSTPSSWLDGQRYQNGALNIADYSNTGSYNPWMRATNTWSSGPEDAKIGRWFSFGTLGASFYWIGSTTTRTANSYDHAMIYNIANGTLTAETFSGNLNGNATTATTATNLSAKPSLAASGNNITVTAGGKTSDAFTVPYATSAGSATTASKLTAITTTDAASSTATWRRLWISYSNNTEGRPAYTDSLVYQTSTNTLKTPHLLIEHVSGGQAEMHITYSTTIDYWWGVGTANVNHGLYDNKANKWIILAGADNKWSFDGNAATATSATSATTATTASKLSNTAAIGNTDHPVYFTNGGVPAQTTYRMAGTNATATTGITYSGDLDTGIWYVNNITGTDKTTLYNQSDGVIIANKYSTSWISEIYQDYRTGQLAVRGKNNGIWAAWRNILDSTNYTNYTVTKTGTGASGSWGISITGNAATASKISAKLAATTKTYLLGTATAITATAANVSLTGDTGVYLTTTAGELSAYRYSWHYGANERAYTLWNDTDQSIDFIFI